ncbi:ATP-binding protein, partial [Burkholderia ubonensis]|uniref:ATP-binding protein n=1 Tax=Burkholderia ubonensis TaxID=101571 RepID=UPI00075AB10A
MNDNTLHLMDDLTDIQRELGGDANLAELFAALERVDLRVQRHLQALREHEDDRQNLAGMVLSPDMLDARVVSLTGAPPWVLAAPIEDDAEARFDEDALMQGLTQASRLGQLVERFDLTTVELELLLLGLLPQFDHRYGLIFAYMEDDAQRTQPSVAFVQKLLGTSVLDRLSLERALSPSAPLRHHGLMVVKPPKAGQVATLQADAALYRYLIGHDELPERLHGWVRWLEPVTGLPEFHPEFIARLAQRLDADAAEPAVILLRGAAGSGRGAAVAAAAAQLGCPALCVDLSLLPEDNEEASDALVLALREARLRAACLVLRGMAEFADTRARLLARLQQRLPAHTGPVVCLIEPHATPVWLGELSHVLLTLPERTLADNVALVRSQLALDGAAAHLNLAGLVRRFAVSPDTLAQTLQEAERYRQQRDPDAALTDADLYAAFRLRAQQNFGKLAQRIEPVRSFDDLIVSDALHGELREILAAIRHRDDVLSQGFARKIGYGFGISALFHGDSGTGKTMAAEALAYALGVDLIKVDLSSVVNKYIGETEKNLSRIFDLASADAGVLFFDEADALFGKRSETKDAHDRHANIEVAYLLQRLEGYPGLVVLATNHRGHLDSAFSRRLTFITHFAFPDARLRERMWRQIWPARIALAEDVDFAALARQTELTGANIRNVALLASWLAAEDATPVTRAHITQAVRRELSKMGR